MKWRGFSWPEAIDHISDPIIVHAQLGVDARISWVPAAVCVPLHTLQLAVTHHHTAVFILQWEAQRKERKYGQTAG